MKLYILHNWYDCLITHIIVSILGYNYSYNCMYPCFIIVSISKYKYSYNRMYSCFIIVCKHVCSDFDHL